MKILQVTMKIIISTTYTSLINDLMKRKVNYILAWTTVKRHEKHLILKSKDQICLFLLKL